VNSIVFRGIPGDQFTEIIKAARSWHDGEIILSTWEDAQVPSGLVDKIVRDDDPGQVYDIANPSLVHAHRQVLAAYNGVLAASGEKVLLTRADIIHRASLFDFVMERDASANVFNKLFSHKVVCSNMMTFDPDTKYGPPRDRYYRVCDWFQCGYREDILKFVDVKNEIEKYKHSGCCLEQLWFISSVNKHSENTIVPVLIEETLSTINDSWKTLLTNFKVVDTRSTAKADNYRWLHQPEYFSCYITEKKYEAKKIEMGY
jgi:hypothetical protein